MRVLQIHDRVLREAEGAGAEGIDRSAPRSNGGGGLAVYVGGLMQELRARGTRVSAVSLVGDPDPSVNGSSGDYELPAFRYRYRPEVVAQLEQIVEREDPEVIHLHAMAHLHPRLIRRLIRLRPVVWTFHDVSTVCFRRNLLDAQGSICERALGFGCVTGGCFRPGSVESTAADLLRVAMHRRHLAAQRRAQLVTVPSQYMSQVLIRNGFDPARVVVVPLFSRFGGDQESLEREPGATRLLFAGRLIREKGASELLRCLALLREESWSATIVGEGPMRREVEAQSAAAGLGQRVRFVGELLPSEVDGAYQRSDIVVFPSLVPESFGLVGVEAMSHAKPVVAFESGGVTEWLEDGVTGRLVRHADSEHLAECLRELIRDPARGRAMGAAGRRSQLAHFTADEHIRRLSAVYERAVREGAR